MTISKSYIRTKYKIVEIKPFTSFDYEDVIVKQADTIEELCDMFIVDEGLETPMTCGNFEELKYWFDYNKRHQYRINNCYGAIWTDKGLIYVAKINDTGELELI